MTTDLNVKPATRRALLVNPEGRPTAHVYSHTAEVIISMSDGLRPAAGFMFKCEETGAVRLWGYQLFKSEGASW